MEPSPHFSHHCHPVNMKLLCALLALVNFGQSAPAYHKPDPAYHAPAPVYYKHASAYQQPTPAYNKPALAYNKPAPAYHAPSPTYQNPAPAYHAQVPAYQKAAPVYSAPAPSYHPEIDDATPYSYEYGVHDEYSGNHYNAGETGDEDGNVEGSYSVSLPDGRTQHVTYHAGQYKGYVAEVTYEGKAQSDTYHAQTV